MFEFDFNKKPQEQTVKKMDPLTKQAGNETEEVSKSLEKLIQAYLSDRKGKHRWPLKKLIDSIEKEAIESVLAKTLGSQKAACLILGMKETTLSGKMKKLNIPKTKTTDIILLNSKILK